MITTDDIKSLLNGVRCYACLGISMPKLVELALYRDWLLSVYPSADTSLAALTENGKCLACYGMKAFDVLRLSLLSEISFWLSTSGQTVLAFLSATGITDSTQVSAIRNLVTSAVDHGWWDKCDLIYPFVGGNATAHSINLKSPGDFTITWNGTVTHDANGITGDGATGYGNTHYIPRTSGQITQNSGHVSHYLRTKGTILMWYCGAALLIGTRNGTGTTQVRTMVNDGNLSTFNNVGLGLMMAARTDGSTKRNYYTTEQTAANLSSLVGNSEFYVLDMNAGGGPHMTNANLASLTVGIGMTFSEYQAFAADWQTFQTALGRQI